MLIANMRFEIQRHSVLRELSNERLVGCQH